MFAFTLTTFCHTWTFKCWTLLWPDQELQKPEDSCAGTGSQSEGARVDETNSAPQQKPSAGVTQRGCYAAPLWNKIWSTCDFYQLEDEDNFFCGSAFVYFQMPKKNKQRVKRKWLPRWKSTRSKVMQRLYRWGCFPKAKDNHCKVIFHQLTYVFWTLPKASFDISQHSSLERQNVPKASPPGYHPPMDQTAGERTSAQNSRLLTP